MLVSGGRLIVIDMGPQVPRGMWNRLLNRVLNMAERVGIQFAHTSVLQAAGFVVTEETIGDGAIAARMWVAEKTAPAMSSS